MDKNEKRVVKQISFSKENSDVWDILDKQKNASQYVCDAVRAYKNKQDSMITVDKEELRGIIQEAITSNDLKGIVKEAFENL